jgi:hypothetical protein
VSGPPAECPTCRAKENEPCVGDDGKPVAGVHSERVVAACRAMFGAFAPPLPKVNGPAGGAA